MYYCIVRRIHLKLIDWIVGMRPCTILQFRIQSKSTINHSKWQYSTRIIVVKHLHIMHCMSRIWLKRFIRFVKKDTFISFFIVRPRGKLTFFVDSFIDWHLTFSKPCWCEHSQWRVYADIIDWTSTQLSGRRLSIDETVSESLRFPHGLAIKASKSCLEYVSLIHSTKWSWIACICNLSLWRVNYASV